MKLKNTHPGPEGKTITEKLWDEMDRSYENVVNSKDSESFQRWTYQGTCIGLAKALALMTNMSYDAVRQEAAERHRSKVVDAPSGAE